MNKLIILLLVTPTFLFGQETNYYNPHKELVAGTYYLFGDNVKFRKMPDPNSDVIELLKIGTPIQVIEPSDVTLTYNGIESPFYKVSYNNKVGYILGGLISIEKRKKNDSSYLFAFKREEKYYSIIIRLLKGDSEVIESVSQLATELFSIDLLGNQGIEGVENILFINYLAEACGVDGGGIYYFQFEKELKKVFEVSQIADGGVFWSVEELIFPEEKEGVKGKIVYQKETGVYKDEETNWVEINRVSRELEWKEGEILPKLEPQE